MTFVLPITTNRYYILSFHLLLSFLVILFYYKYKKLSTFNYNFWRRILLFISTLTIVETIFNHFLSGLILSNTAWDTITIWMHIVSQFDICRTCTIPKDIVSSYDNEDGNIYCCTRDLDKLVRLIMFLWSIILVVSLIMTSGREKKLTRGRSCEFASRKYPGNYNEFYELCVELDYKYFPIRSLEEYVTKLEHPVQKEDIDQFITYFKEDEEDHKRNCKQFADNNINAQKSYDDKMAENLVVYNRCMKNNVIDRRKQDTWTYEEYLKQKDDVTLHTQPPPINIIITNNGNNNNNNNNNKNKEIES